MSAAGIEYVLRDGVDLEAIGVALSARFEIAADRERSSQRTFYDTFDGRLHARGLALIHENRRLALIDERQDELAGVELARRPRSLFVADLPEGRLRQALAPVASVRALSEIVRVRSHVLPARVLNADAKTVVRLFVEEPFALPPRVRLAAVRGYEKPLAAVRRVLEQDLGLTAPEETVPDATLRQAGGVPGGVPSNISLALPAGQRADAAASVLLRHLLAIIERNLSGAIADIDTEFLHDLRVAARRSRSAQRQLRHVFPPVPLSHFRSEFRWLQQVTGPSRDLDVYVLELADPPAVLEPLRKLLLERRRVERRRMVRALRSTRMSTLLAEWGAFLEELVEAPMEDRRDAERPVKEVAAERLGAVYTRMVKKGGAIDDSSPPAALHDLRKTGKELRYLLEFFSSLFPAEVVRPMVRTLKSLQKTLGRFQDCEVQADVMRSLRGEVAGRDGGPAALLAMGQLVDRLEREQTRARSEFAECFVHFASRPQRRRVRETFT
jgi:CHAD domain-containing protein